ncbi:OPT oligopeptide transporter protein-domain-containing protein [Pisolithus marmoratus]|nr:OPT oligopeptide transporter protein-domain-containing protein [Pisolithus marmoratus]
MSTPISIGEKESPVSLHTEEAISPTAEKACGEAEYNEGDAVFVKGEPLIATGRDVSPYPVDLRDDGDPALTFRSLFMGTVFAFLGAAFCQIYHFKPVQVSVPTVFLLLLVYSWGLAWAKFIPRRSSVEGTRLEKLGPILEFLNPGEFRIKGHVTATLVASTAASSNTAVLNFAVQHAITMVLATFSTSCFGYGLCGLLRPLTVYPSEMVYWMVALHFDTAANHKRMRLFWLAFTGMFIWAIIPSYIFPLLNGISILCLASQHAKPSIQDMFTNIFGGIDGDEGLGLLSISLDWQYITSVSMSLRLIQQGNSLSLYVYSSHDRPANTWVGFALCYIIITVIYYSNVWNSLTFPMLSTSIFSSNGSIYDQSTVFGNTFQLNQTALEEVGLPHMTGSNVWLNITANLSVSKIGGLLAHCLCFWGPYLRDTLRNRHFETRSDPHWKAMQKYDEAPLWWYIGLLVLALFSGLIVIIKGQTTLPWYSYIVALLLGSFVTPFSQLLVARMGNGIATNQLMKMVGGAITPGRPVANLYFSMWSHDIIQRSVALAADLKRTILVKPNGNNIWSGQLVQSLNSNAVTWSPSKELYGPGGPYFIVPLSLLIGVVPTIILWFVAKRWPTIGPVKVDSIILPIIYMEYNYVLGGALDGGAQVMIFILSFAVFGASDKPKPFYSWVSNPAKGNVDYCNGNGRLVILPTKVNKYHP